MTPQTVRAVLAYVMTLSLLVCLAAFLFSTLTVVQAAAVGTVVGAIISNAKVPLAYFFDGVAAPDTVTPAAAAPAPGPATAPVVPPAV